MNGDFRAAQRVYRELLRRDSNDPLGWLGLGGVALRLGDSLEFQRASEKLRSYSPNGAEVRQIRRHLAYYPEVWPRPSYEQ